MKGFILSILIVVCNPLLSWESEVYSENLVEFTIEQRQEIIRMIESWNKYGLPKHFENKEIKFVLCRLNGKIFLTNHYYQICTLDDDHLRVWFFCTCCDNWGFLEDCVNENGTCKWCGSLDTYWENLLDMLDE